MEITLSVVIPAYNADKFIVATLDSVAMQSRPPEQIIVIDDGSTDNTTTLVEQWSKDRGIVVDLIRQRNQGVPVARNRGITASTGNWIALLDADDLFLPNHLSEMERAIKSQPDIIAAFGDGVLFGRSGNESAPFSRKKALSAASASNIDGIYLLEEKLYQSLLPGLYIMPCCFIFKRAPVVEMGMFDETLRYIEDRDFMLRLSKKGKFAFVDTVTARARMHESNITHPKNTTRNTYFVLRVLEKALAHATEFDLSEEEIRLTKIELRRAGSQLLYSASMDGLRSYANAVQRLRKMPYDFSSFNPKHFLRALYYIFRN